MEGRSDVHLETSTTYSSPRLGSDDFKSQGSCRLRPHGARGCRARPPGRLGPPPRASPIPPRSWSRKALRGPRGRARTTTAAGPPGPRPSGSGARGHPAASPVQPTPPLPSATLPVARGLARRRRKRTGRAGPGVADVLGNAVLPPPPTPHAGFPPGSAASSAEVFHGDGSLASRTRWGPGSGRPADPWAPPFCEARRPELGCV